MNELKINYLYPENGIKQQKREYESIKKMISEVLNISKDSIDSIELVGGMTNKNFKFFMNNEYYILRIPGNGANKIISRHDEKYNSLIISDLELDTDILYFNEETGIKIAKYINNAETINQETAKKKDTMIETTNLLRTLHKSKLKFSNEFNVFNKIEEYEKILKQSNGNNFKDYFLVKHKVLELKKILENLGEESVPCHNDAVPENFVKSDDKLYLVDWEYSGMNDPIWDLAAHCLECDFSNNEEELFLSLYFNKEVEPRYKTKMLIYKICQDFLWSMWTNIKEADGDDFGTYGEYRYNRAKSNINKILKLH
ncbi:choline kinase,CTP:phosphocholine cytidylyltransferase involved in choline phosphorylation for cell surface LPS epitopes,thiamine kinase,Choline/ethanolamine kinase [[Clostridium] sordellii]|uniref:choline/ethanolamine kinase family protein n=1 Tax=Paraclostridium sordellii TaxID=1505 RepID=UPI000541E61B|nr:choline/ethanolamine kinase family protein [Paeniclostridium sordellii]CEK32877.1 choline kinase,CTP:phosphocholine cytidylyltransferase involved in choline phosphorylation for cell surface LPS epitopes,thiamine kinase,Choline/ethanolamine kinase [[Clostridium] sordellii] [Paeniclostridium sordellii]